MNAERTNVNLDELTKKIEAVKKSCPVAVSLEECIIRDARGIDPREETENSIAFVGNGKAVARYVQMVYLREILKTYPDEGQRIMAMMDQLNEPSSWLGDILADAALENSRGEGDSI